MTIEQLVDEDLRRGEKKSAPYRQGILDLLNRKLAQIPMPVRYEPGSVEFDAYYAGVSHGHAILHAIRPAYARTAR